MRIGSGYDVHRLVAGRALVLGGVEIPFDKGLKGHSDADVLVHSVCDAMLGGAGLGDLGRHFPDSDPCYKNISSLILLKECTRLLKEKGYAVSNIDSTILAQAPKIEPHKPAMEKNIADACGLSSDVVNVKATTTEGLGFAGRGEGIGAHAIVLIRDLGSKGPK